MSAAPPEQLLTLRQVIGAVSLSNSTIYRNISAGTFPAPLRIGPNSVRWRQSEITAWCDALPKATYEPPAAPAPCSAEPASGAAP